MLEATLSMVFLSLAVMVGMAAVTVWILMAYNSCNHSYKRIDNANDKNMILVCSRCGKIKKLRK